MRGLLLPVIPTRKGINKESDYIVYRDIVKGLVDKAFFFLCVPKGAKGYVIEVFENAELVEVDTFREDFILSRSYVSGELLKLFHPAWGKYPIDFVIASGAEASMVLSIWFNTTPRKVPVFTLEPHVAEKSEKHDTVFQDLGFMTRAFSYGACINLLSTEREIELCKRLCARYLSPYLVNQLMDHTDLTPLWVKCDEIDRISPKRPQHLSPSKGKSGTATNTIDSQSFKVAFIGRLTGNKNWQWCMKQIERFYAYGRKIEVIVSAPLKPKVYAPGPRWKIFSCDQWEDYISLLKGIKISLNNSKTEGCAVGILEQIYSGVIAVLPRKKWAEALVGSDYPFFYENGGKEAYAVMKQVFDHYEENREKLEPVRKMIKDRYDIKGGIDRLYQRIGKEVGKVKIRRVDKVNRNIRQKEKVYVQDLMNELNNGASELMVQRGKVPSSWDVYKNVVASGRFVDALDGPWPRFEARV